MESSLILKKNGLKSTLSRLAMLDLFVQNSKPINAEYIHRKIKKTNIVTIYRNLLSLEKMGILKKVDIHKDSIFYELSGHHHHHIVCTSCGIIEDFEGCIGNDVFKKTLKNSKKFKSINEHSMEFFGLCKSCTKK